MNDRIASVSFEFPDSSTAGLGGGLVEDVFYVLFHGARRTAEDDRDFAVALAFPHPVEDVTFALSEPVNFVRRAGEWAEQLRSAVSEADVT